MTKTSNSNDYGAALALLALIVCEALWFGPIISKVGFYLDDWRTYCELFFSNQDLTSLLRTSFADARLTPRPLEAIFFIASWLSFGSKPLWHHIINCCLEVFVCWFLYLAMARLTHLRSLSFIAALILLVLPAHDATHYWATANTITLSLALYCFSLWQLIKGVQERSYWPILASALAFLASMFNYEAFAPLCLLNSTCCAYLVRPRVGRNWTQALVRTLIISVPYMLSVGAALFYQKVLLHGSGLQHPPSLEPGRFLNVFLHGWNCTLSPAAIGFYVEQARVGLSNHFAGLPLINILLLIALLAVVSTTTIILAVSDKYSKRIWLFPTLGIAAFFLSYSIYGLSDEYTPLLDSILNRTNYGGSMAAALILAGVVGLVCRIPGHSRITAALVSAACLPIIAVSVLSDWGMAGPWIVSWAFQHEVLKMLESRKRELRGGDTVLLANSPRYSMWSPVFDGVWDFQPAVQMTLKNVDIHAGVVSERMVLSRNDIKDVSRGALCGAYPFRRLFVLTPYPNHWYQVHSPEEFISLIEDRGMDFGLNPRIIEQWKAQSAQIMR